MEFCIPCDTYARLANIALSVENNDYKSIRIEHKNGNAIAIATNVKIAAIENLGKCDGPDGAVNLIIDPSLIKQCEIETEWNGKLFVLVNDILKFASAKTSLGFNFTSNAMINLSPEIETIWSNWRTWLPDDLPKKTHGPMFTNLDALGILASSSPSGKVVWPEFIDKRYPVVVNDVVDERWIGLFMPSSNELDKNIKPAIIPHWVK